jgi:hypothetical protein
VSVIATSNYFAYLIGRKQATYEELRKQVDRVVQLIDDKKVEEEPVPTSLKQRQERLRPDASGLTDLTTSTINGKTMVVAPEPAPVERPTPAALLPDTPPAQELSPPPPPGPSLNAKKHRDTRGVSPARRPRVSRTSAAQNQGSTETEQPAQSTRDVGAAGQ